MQTSTIKFSQIEDRIDAEYYKPEYLEIYQILENKKIVRLREIVEKLVNGGTPDTGEGKFYEKGILFLKNGNIKEMEIDYDNVEFILEESHKIRERSALKKNDVLVTIAGTIGNAAVFNRDIAANINQNICRIVVKNINPYYLSVFLNSKFGRNQILQRATVQTIQYVNNQIIGDLEIFIPLQSFQQKIEKMVKVAQEKRKLADEKYKEAEEILNKELGLENLDLSTQKTFEAKFSETEDRFDPEYYQPKYKKIKELLSEKKLKVKLLKSFVKKYNCGFAFPTETYLEKGIPLLRIKNLKRIEIDFKGVELLPDLDEYQEFVAKSGDILISMSGTVGATSLVPENIQKAFVNQRITSISTEGIDKLYLCFYLNLQAINSLMVGGTTGGVQKNITYQDIVSIPVPILSESLQQKISSLIQQSFKLHQEAKELIEQAKQKVEELIEK